MQILQSQNVLYKKYKREYEEQNIKFVLAILIQINVQVN